MAISYVANSAAYQNRNGADPATIACGVNVTAGNLICVGIGWKDANGVAEIVGISDTKGSTYAWTNLNVNSNGLTCVLAWAEAAGSGANTVSIDFNAAQTVCDLTVCEFAGFADAPALAAYKAIISNADPVATGNTGAPGATDCVAVAIGEAVTLHFDAVSDPWSPSGGTALYNGGTDYLLAYKILTSNTAQAIGQSFDGSGYWGVVIGIFINQAAGGTTLTINVNDAINQTEALD